MKKYLPLFMIFIFTISACQSGSADDAAGVTEAYIQAWADKDKAAITGFSCKEWEEGAILAIDGLLSVESNATDIACEVTSESDGSAQVNCSGSLDLTYDGEIQARSLSGRTFSLKKEDGQWRVCSFE